MLANEGLKLAQAVIPVCGIHRSEVNQCDRAILQRGVYLSPNVVQKPLQFNHFWATCFDYHKNINMPSDQMDLSAVMHGNNEHDKLALEGFMTPFCSCSMRRW